MNMLDGYGMDTITLADLCVESQSNTCPNCTCPGYTHELEVGLQTGQRKPRGPLA